MTWNVIAKPCATAEVILNPLTVLRSHEVVAETAETKGGVQSKVLTGRGGYRAVRAVPLWAGS